MIVNAHVIRAIPIAVTRPATRGTFTPELLESPFGGVVDVTPELLGAIATPDDWSPSIASLVDVGMASTVVGEAPHISKK